VNAISRSRPGDYVAALFGRQPYACRWCRRRFRARARNVEVLAPAERALPHDDDPGPSRSPQEKPPAVVEVAAGVDRRSVQRR
jgi:hypothetical protein